jgi:dTMP kinase
MVRTVRPALERGEWVISDRFADSSIAYQGYGQGLGPELVGRIQAMALDRFAPDLTLVLDVPPEVGLARAGGRGGAEDRYERMADDFHTRVRAGFLALAATAPARYAVIDATQDADRVEAAVLAAVTERLGA